MAKTPIELAWIEDLLPEGLWRRKSMFGGFAYYNEQRLFLILFEGDDPRWSGALFPVEKDLQSQALRQQPMLKPHTVLPKWLFLPIQTESFDENIQSILKGIFRPNSIWGSYPKPKTPKNPKKKEEKISTKVDTRKPRMFSDESPAEALKNAKRVCDLKNIGTGTEKAFAKAGITTAQQIIKMGWKKAMKKMVATNPKYRHSIFAYSLIGAMTNKEFSRISDEEKEEARAFTKSLAQPKTKQRIKKNN